MDFPFIGGSYQGRSKNINSQRCINYFPVLDKEGGKSIMALFCTPGLVEWKDFNKIEPVRGMHVFGGVLYVVVGETVYSVTTAGVATSLGTLNSNSGYVWMENNGSQLMIVDGITGYIWNGTTLAEILDADFPGAGSLTFQDSYFIIHEPDTGKYWISNQNDGTAWDATDYKTAEAKPDNLIATFSYNEELWNFGARSCEIHYNSGNADFPFSRIPKGVIEVGLGAAASVAKTQKALYWLDNNLQVRQATGYIARVISTPQITYQFEKYSFTGDAISYTFQQEGRDFYVLTFPQAVKTWVFCEQTEFWHEWVSYPNHTRHRSNCYAWFDGKHLVGDWALGKIYKLDLDVFTDDGNTIRRERTAMAVQDPEDRKTLFHHWLEIDFEGGGEMPADAVSTYGTEPYAMLSWSDDGGHTWSNEYWASIGKTGEHAHRAAWRRLGSSRERVYRMRISSPVKSHIIGAKLRATVGNS